MFDFLKKKVDKNLYAPVTGECIDITNVKDKTFSEKLLGDGLAFEPDGNTVYSPCNGVITMIFPSNHAFGIKMDDGKEVLIHIGIDTVNLNGEGFEALKKVDDKVKAGDPVIRFNRGLILSKNYPLTTMLVITEANDEIMKKGKIGSHVEFKEPVILY